MTTQAMRVKIPANTDLPDRVLAGLTAHQLAILSVAAVILWGLHELVPLPVLGVVAMPVMGVATALALGRRDGVGLDRLLLAAWRQNRAPRRHVYAPDGITPAPTGAPGAQPEPLWLPVQTIRPDGTLNLGPDGVAALVDCSTVSFALRTGEEQQALVGAFGRWLNSLTQPIQLVIAAERVNLAPAIERLRNDAPTLPHPALERAAYEHAAFLSRLDASRDLLRRRVLLVLREPHSSDLDGAAGRVLRRAEDAVRTLAAASITARLLDANQAAAVLASCVDPGCPPGLTGQTLPGEPVTGGFA